MKGLYVEYSMSKMVAWHRKHLSFIVQPTVVRQSSAASDCHDNISNQRGECDSPAAIATPACEDTFPEQQEPCTYICFNPTISNAAALA